MLWYRKTPPAAAHRLNLRLTNMGGDLVPEGRSMAICAREAGCGPRPSVLRLYGREARKNGTGPEEKSGVKNLRDAIRVT
jgi:hypothetical protein